VKDNPPTLPVGKEEIMGNVWKYVIAAAALGSAVQVWGQGAYQPLRHDLYDLRADALDLSTDSSRIRDERTALRRLAAEYSRTAAEEGTSSLRARSAEMELEKAQIALHTTLGDLRKDSWQAYVASRDLSAELRDIRRYELARSLYNLNNDLTDQKYDRPEVQADRAALRATLEAYADCLARHGPRSSQTHAAEYKVDEVQIGLHRDLGDYRQDLWNLLKKNERLQEPDLSRNG
jgi:hypothetical protein